MKKEKYGPARWLIPLLLLGLSCSVKYIGPGPVGMSVSVKDPGVKGEVRIVRDENYIVHVLADREEDLYFGVGFAMAQDRFSQMDMARRVAMGTLSEWLGNPIRYKNLNLPMLDGVMRTFRFKEEAARGVAAMDDKTRRLLDAFTAGVNKYLDEIGDNKLFEYPRGVKPEKWKPEDSLAAAELFGLSMTVDCIFEEYYYDRIASLVGPEKVKDFLPAYPNDAPIITASREAANGPAMIEAFSALRSLFRDLVPHPIGSNNWVVAGSRTATGKALLANDPHVPLFNMPTFWYHCHLKGGGIDIAGMMFPGFPGFGAGMNGKIAWGLTNVMADYIDLFRERVNPSDPNLYLYKDHWEAFKTVREVIKVKGKKEPIHFSYRMSRHGPVLETGVAGKYKIRDWEPKEVIAFKYVDMYLGDFMKGYFQIVSAKNWNEFRAASKLISVGPYGWNHVFADAMGNIGYQTTANIPMRADNQGIFMHRGWTGEDEWVGYVPFDQLPHAYNPSKGYLLSANNRVEPDDYPYYISSTYLPFRAARINEFLAAHPNTTVKDMMALQADVVDIGARRRVPYILKDLETASGGRYGDVIAALKEYQRNNYESRVDLTGPTVYYLFMNYFTPLILRDELGKNLADIVGGGDIPLGDNLIERIMPDENNPWFDDVKTAGRETRADMTLKAMDEAEKWMRKKLGRNPENWTWGRAHKLTLVQPYAAYIWKRIGRKGLIRGPYPYPGSSETVSAAGGMFFPWVGFRVDVGSSSRLIVDFSHPEWFYYAASTGMASNPDDPHFDNLTEKWLKHEYFQMKLEEKAFMEGNKGTVVIRP